jgi:hypothetical protein
MIVGGLKSSTSRRRYRKDCREVKLIHTKPSQPLHWSKQTITFSRADHWVHILDPDTYPLVVEPIVEGTLLAQTLIDGGSGLNIISVDTLKKMDFDFKRLTECDEPFFGTARWPTPWVGSPSQSCSARKRTSARNTSILRSLTSSRPTTPSVTTLLGKYRTIA